MSGEPIIPGRIGVKTFHMPTPLADGGTVAVPSPGGVKIIQVGGLSIQEEIARGFLQAAFVGGQAPFFDAGAIVGEADPKKLRVMDAAHWRDVIIRQAVDWADAFLRVTRGPPVNHEEANGGS